MFSLSGEQLHTGDWLLSGQVVIVSGRNSESLGRQLPFLVAERMPSPGVRSDVGRPERPPSIAGSGLPIRTTAAFHPCATLYLQTEVTLQQCTNTPPELPMYWLLPLIAL